MTRPKNNVVRWVGEARPNNGALGDRWNSGGYEYEMTEQGWELVPDHVGASGQVMVVRSEAPGGWRYEPPGFQ